MGSPPLSSYIPHAHYLVTININAAFTSCYLARARPSMSCPTFSMLHASSRTVRALRVTVEYNYAHTPMNETCCECLKIAMF